MDRMGLFRVQIAVASMEGASPSPFRMRWSRPEANTLLGVHSLEGLNLKVDPVRKELIPAGPVITGCAA